MAAPRRTNRQPPAPPAPGPSNDPPKPNFRRSPTRQPSATRPPHRPLVSSPPAQPRSGLTLVQHHQVLRRSRLALLQNRRRQLFLACEGVGTPWRGRGCWGSSSAVIGSTAISWSALMEGWVIDLEPACLGRRALGPGTVLALTPAAWSSANSLHRTPSSSPDQLQPLARNTIATRDGARA